ncbi:Transcriptional regulatory protein [Apophysomyces ossiformis]|uniref:Transcriptional regulatory protein n=1 Tax=Apophysomyces ossiformis TaxID=679940 RepID=A0A8H7ETY1_9FUNG|nr:Transcriptional regulatory protein [Apophysomyces ossiformis]
MESLPESVLDSNRSEDGPGQISSKLSLGSSPSVLSPEEPLDGDGPLTPTDRIDDVEELFAYHEDSPEPLSNESTDTDNDAANDDDLHSASPLSSVPDDFPLSPSSSPKPTDTLLARKRKKEDEDEDGEDDHGQEEMEAGDCPKESNENQDETENNSNKRHKQDCGSEEENGDNHGNSEEEAHEGLSEESKASKEADEHVRINGDTKGYNNKRRASKSLDGSPRRRRRTSKDSVSDSDMDKIERIPDDMERDDETQAMEDGKRAKSEREKQTKESVKDSRAKSNKPIATDPAGNGAVDHVNDDYDYHLRHKEAFEALTHIEIEFARLRDKMYQEKMAELNEEATMIANGTHPELVALMEEIEARKGQRIRTAEAWRKHQHQSFQQQFEGFEYQANVHFISQKSALRREIITSINGRRWKMDEERGKLNEGVAAATPQSLVPNTHSMLLQKRERKEEASELQDIKEVIGFPMAPKPSGLTDKDIREDLAALGVSKE